MHTVDTLSYGDFDFTLNQQPATLEDIFPGFHEQDRIGVVVRKAGGGMGASALLMSALTRFYDFHRPYLGERRIYLEFFIFHVGQPHMNHAWMDVWPPHKEVVVEDDPEQILEAINDRAITRLLVEDIPPSMGTFLRETVSSAENRIVSALAYSASGRVHQGDISITSCSVAEANVLDSLQRTEELSEDVKQSLRQGRKSLLVHGRIVETYRRISLTEALHRLSSSKEPGTTTRKYLDILYKG